MTNPAELLGLTNPEAETAVLAAMLQDTDASIEMAQLLEPGDFCDPRRALVFEAMVRVLMTNEPLDMAAVAATMQGIQRERRERDRVFVADDYLDTFAAVDTARAMSYAHSVKRLSWLRGAADFAHWLVEELQTRPDPDQLFPAAQERWQILQPSKAGSRFVYGWDTLKLHQGVIRQRIQEREEGTQKIFDWPWASWNKDGRVRPMRPGILGIIAAADGMGKTTFLEMIAEHWAQRGMQTVYVHLEDQLDYKLDRRAARHALVPLNRIEDGDLTPDEQHKLADANYRMGAWADGLHYLDAAGENMVSIVRELEARVAEGVCDCVVFDYIDKVQASRGQTKLFGNNTWERQANDVELLKDFAEKCKIPVLTATQGNKAMQNQGQVQTRQTIQGSGQKSQKSQLVIILTRDLVGADGLKDVRGVQIAEPGEYSPLVKVRVDKQNRGKTGVTFEQFLMGQYFTVRDINKHF